MLYSKIQAREAPRIDFARSLSNALFAACLVSFALPANAGDDLPQGDATTLASVSVNSAAELASAITAATGPTEILLASGNYGNASIKGINKPFEIIIKSESKTNRAIFSGFTFYQTSNFRMDNIVFSRQLPNGEPLPSTSVFVKNGTNISFSSCEFSGTKDSNANNDGLMLFITASNKILVFNSQFLQSRTSALLQNSDNVFFLRNHLTQSREGLNIDGIKYGYIERNLFTEIAPNIASGDHSDAIQMYIGTPLRQSDGINILANAMILNDAQTQGIFIQRSNANTTKMHSAIIIRENIYYGGMRQGIWVEDSNSVLIEKNTTVGATGFSYQPAVYLKNVLSSTVRKNISHFYIYESPVSPVASANIDLADAVYPTGPSAQTQFQGTVSGRDPALTNFRTLAGSAAAIAGAGAFVYGDIGLVKGTDAAVESLYQTEWARVLAR